MGKYFAYIVCFIIVTVFIIPTMIGMTDSKIKENEPEIGGELKVDVINEVNFEEKINKYQDMIKNNQDNSFEEYIKCVVAAEMPIGFETEALKAQAVAARTYAVRNAKDIYNIEPKSLGQAYISIDNMKKNWGSNFEKNYEKLNKAVGDTRGLIMVYNDEPILAAFYSTSAGKTELAENVWGNQLPYIKSVDSSYDKKAPNYEAKAEFTYARAAKILRAYNTNINGSDKEIIDSFEIRERTEAGYVKYIRVLRKNIKGTEIRKIFSLRSNNFKIQKTGEMLIFTTIGYGHGVGMSQYGAEYMAEEGKTFDEILMHYYQDIIIRNY